MKMGTIASPQRYDGASGSERRLADATATSRNLFDRIAHTESHAPDYFATVDQRRCGFRIARDRSMHASVCRTDLGNLEWSCGPRSFIRQDHPARRNRHRIDRGGTSPGSLVPRQALPAAGLSKPTSRQLSAATLDARGTHGASAVAPYGPGGQSCTSLL